MDTSKTVYCPRHRHTKDTLVCRLSCPYYKKCPVFKDYQNRFRRELEKRIDEYLDSHPGRFDRIFYLEAIRNMKEEMFLALNNESQPFLLTRDEVLRRAEKGERFLHIYRVAQEMELRFQLVPKKDDPAADQPQGKSPRSKKTAVREQQASLFKSSD